MSANPLERIQRCLSTLKESPALLSAVEHCTNDFFSAGTVERSRMNEALVMTIFFEDLSEATRPGLSSSGDSGSGSDEQKTNSKQ